MATIMRVSKMTVYRLVHSGELEAIRVGRSFRVPEQAVNQYLREAFARHRLSADLAGPSRDGAASTVIFYTVYVQPPSSGRTAAWPSSVQSSEG